MAKIIYGLSGQGFGHSTRCKEIIRQLINNGHQVKIFTYGQSLFILEKEFKQQIFEIPGFVLSYRKNKLIYWKTIYENVKKFSHQTRYWKKVSAEFSDFNPDLVITDFEPLTALLAKTKKKPLISIDNQHQLTNTEIELPLKYKKDFLADQLVVKLLVWGAKYYLITSFFKTKINKKNTFIFAPIIREEILNLKTEEKNYILVYQGADFSNILPTLKKIKHKFLIVGPDRQGKDGNVTFVKYSFDEWLKLLAGAKAVIGTAGLSLISECIYLEKPYLALPIKNQVEQTINALYLEKNNLGMHAEKFTEAVFNEFVSNFAYYKNNLKQADKCGNKQLSKKLEELITSLLEKKP
jgi:uncharacterized protein (TIGR00661 family)